MTKIDKFLILDSIEVRCPVWGRYNGISLVTCVGSGEANSIREMMDALLLPLIDGMVSHPFK